MGKLPGGSSKINRLSLNRCMGGYTEIFSKRRKIYAVCVESLSMPLDQLRLSQTIPDFKDVLMKETNCNAFKS